MRRDGLLTLLLALVLLAIVPAYDRVFTDASWRAGALTAAAIGLLVAAIARRARLPSVAAVVLAGAGLFAALPWLLGVGDGWGAGAGEQLEALRLTLADGWLALAEQPAPSEPLVGLRLLTIVAWWAVALLSHEVVVRGGHIAAGLVNLTILWAVPLAIPAAAPDTLLLVVPFLLTGGLLLLAAVNTREDTPQAIPLPASGLALLGIAIAAGTASPWLLPAHGSDAWLNLGSTATARGYQPIVDISNRLNAPEEREVLRVRSSQRTYLRLAGLDTFDGATWRLGPPGSQSFRPDPARLFPADQPLPPEEPAASTQVIEVDVEVLELENIYVPLPYQPVEVLGPIRDEMVWSTQGGFLATWDEAEEVGGEVGIRQGSAYRVLAERPTPSFADLDAVGFPPEVVSAHTQLPRDYPELGALAEEVYAAAGATSVIERALALQGWFIGPAGGFTYDLDVPALRGEDALTTFVLEDRVGYCEYFATAMAVMLRQTGIPSRVAVGFLPGERVASAAPEAGQPLDEYLVTTGDAHAWVEVLFPGYGWVTFEPTPRSDDAHLLPRADDLAPLENEAERAAREAEEAADEPSDAEGPASDVDTPDLLDLPEETDQGLDGEESAAAADAEGTGWSSLLLVGLVLVAAAGWALPTAVRRRRRQVSSRDPRSAVLAAQRRLYAGARRVGLDRRDHETAREVLARWEREGWIDRGHGPVAEVVQAAAFDGDLDPLRATAAVATLDELTTQLTGRVHRREVVLVPLRRAVAAVTRVWGVGRQQWRQR
ncbi:MAG: transglutaminase domain-containing protein [Nitriliruptor sp.]|nr:MAG: transglutaminase domain-containing protein [Nitriliruptor sp.]